MARKIELVYCVVDGETRHVSDFAHLEPKLRPKSYCPYCKNLLTLKLGKSGKQAHHAAHQTNSTCPLTTPEGILHFNTKLHIFEQLKKGNKLLLPQLCSGWERPVISSFEGGRCACRMWKPERNFVWMENWDNVKLEQFVGNRKPDIVVYRKGQPIAAIEIFATHAVDEEKRKDYEKLGIQWIEVKASEEIFFVEGEAEHGDDEHYDYSWKIYKPLTYRICQPEVPSYVCERCLDAPNQYVKAVKEQLERERIEKRQKTLELLEKKQKEREHLRYLSKFNKVTKAKSMIFLYEDGTSDYHELVAFERVSEKSTFEVLEIYIKDGEKGDVIVNELAPITEDSKSRMRDKLRWWILRKSFRAKEIKISKGWVLFDEVVKLRKTWKLPYIWNSKQMEWKSK